MISISPVYPRPAARPASFPKKTTENRPKNTPHFGGGQETYGTTFMRVLKGAFAIVAGQYGVPMVTDNPIISKAVTTAGLGMLGWSGLKLAKKLTLDTSDESISKLLEDAAACHVIAVTKAASKVDINKPGRDGRTALHVAAYHGHVPIIETLVSAGADINKGNKEGQTPLWLAVKQHKLRSVQALVNMGADVNKPANSGSTPLWVLANYPDSSGWAEAMAGVLIGAGAKLNTPCNYLTPMQVATRSGKSRIAQLLRAHGATDVDTQLRRGREAYWWNQANASTFRA